MSYDQHWMKQALQLAHKALFITTPNPRVGCVIVRNGVILGQGSTQKVGGPHAEICAIRDALQRYDTLRGATFYVTLEPCSHYGRTPPCVEAIIKHQARRVVVAMHDPNPLVAGQGLASLRAAGIEVSQGVCQDEALALNPGFVSRVALSRPWVWTKVACSLDAKVALHNGQSQWITAPAARVDGQTWRARSCVVLTGVGTIMRDNPLLNVRDIKTPRQPIRAVIDSKLQIDPRARFFNGDPVWVFTAQGLDLEKRQKVQQLADLNVEVIEIPCQHDDINHLSLKEVFEFMNQHQINEVHVEAGPGLNGALLSQGYVDELLMYMAPSIIGSGKDAFALSPIESLAQKIQFEVLEFMAMLPDLRLRYRNPQRWQLLQKILEF